MFRDGSHSLFAMMFAGHSNRYRSFSKYKHIFKAIKILPEEFETVSFPLLFFAT